MLAHPFDPAAQPETIARLLLSAQDIAGLRGPLFYFGDPSLLLRPLVSVGGTRTATPWALDAIESLCGALAAEGAVIVSGGAVGTDVAAHRGALAAGGATIVIPPGPLESIDLPRWRPALAQHWDERRTLFLSCFPRGTRVRRGHPLVRNRLVAALGQAAVIGETRLQGGTNHFLRLARERGLPLFLLDTKPREALLRRAFDTLAEDGAVRFGVCEARNPAPFAGRIIEAAARFQQREQRHGSAQLRWLEPGGHYSPDGP